MPKMKNPSLKRQMVAVKLPPALLSEYQSLVAEMALSGLYEGFKTPSLTSLIEAGLKSELSKLKRGLKNEQV